LELLLLELSDGEVFDLPQEFDDDELILEMHA
jgi:hypothetical protein